MASGSAQGLCCELRQAGNRATVAITSCVAVKSEASILEKGPSKTDGPFFSYAATPGRSERGYAASIG